MNIAKVAMAVIISLTSMTYVGTYTVTAYNFNEGGGENYYTAGGYTPTPYYTVATTEEFPIGTILWIEDLGEVQVQDRGNFPADWIDMHIGYDDIDSWDMRERKVYIIERSE